MTTKKWIEWFKKRGFVFSHKSKGSLYLRRKGGSEFIRISKHMPNLKKKFYLWVRPYEGPEYDKEKRREFLDLENN